MPSAVPYTPRGFVPDRWEPNSGRLVDLARQRGRDQGDAIRRGGDISANLWSGIGQNVAGTLREIAAMPEQARQRQMQEMRLQREEAAFTAQQQQQQQDAAKAERLKALTAEFQGQRVPTDRLVKEFGPQDAADIDKAFDELFPAVKPEPGFELSPGQVRYDATGKQIASLPAPEPKPEKLTYGAPTAAMVGGTRVFVRTGSDGKTYDMRGQVVAGDPTPIPPQPTGGNDNEPLESIIGPDGKPVLVRRRDAIGKTRSSGAERPSSGVQKRVLNFFNRAAQADVDTERMEASVQGMNLGGQTWMKYAPNFAQTQLGQQYTQAQRAFTEARLRKDSGAAIPPHEYEADRATYFAEPGDDADTLAQKRRGRAAVLSSLAFESGQALGEFLGSAEEAAAVLDTYKTRAADPTKLKEGATPGVLAVPDLSGVKSGMGRRFTDGPFKGQTWSIGPDGKPFKVGG